jgi:hypothetical protein
LAGFVVLRSLVVVSRSAFEQIVADPAFPGLVTLGANSTQLIFNEALGLTLNLLVRGQLLSTLSLDMVGYLLSLFMSPKTAPDLTLGFLATGMLSEHQAMLREFILMQMPSRLHERLGPLTALPQARGVYEWLGLA